MSTSTTTPRGKAVVNSSVPKIKSTKAQSSNKVIASSKAPSSKSTTTKPSSMNQFHGVGSPFDIMAARIANRVAEMAENVTFTERLPNPNHIPQQQQPATQETRKRPRKLDMRLGEPIDKIKFSAPFLDNTLAKMLDLQTRMLKTSSRLATSNADEMSKRESFEQSAEMSKIIALICAEKARQGA